ncbi:MAG: transcription antitermination factor NusB [Planctomycetota bacterium]
MNDAADAKTRPRSQAREAALRILYQLDLRPELSANELFAGIDAEVEGDDARRFARDLVLGTRRELAAIDRELEAVAINWRLERMAAIDRNVLRLGCYELRYRPDLPPAVSINEAVQLAKTYSTKDSGGFVNGILDKVRKRAQAERSGAAVPAEEGS